MFFIEVVNLFLPTVGPVVLNFYFSAMSSLVHFLLLVKMCTFCSFSNPNMFHSDTAIRSNMGLAKLYLAILPVFHTSVTFLSFSYGEP